MDVTTLTPDALGTLWLARYGNTSVSYITLCTDLLRHQDIDWSDVADVLLGAGVLKEVENSHLELQWK